MHRCGNNTLSIKKSPYLGEAAGISARNGEEIQNCYLPSSAAGRESSAVMITVNHVIDKNVCYHILFSQGDNLLEEDCHDTSISSVYN